MTHYNANLHPYLEIWITCMRNPYVKNINTYICIRIRF
jgi:hypothetical protein